MIFNEPFDPQSQEQRFTSVSHNMYVILVGSHDLFQKQSFALYFTWPWKMNKSCKSYNNE